MFDVVDKASATMYSKQQQIESNMCLKFIALTEHGMAHENAIQYLVQYYWAEQKILTASCDFRQKIEKILAAVPHLIRTDVPPSWRAADSLSGIEGNKAVHVVPHI